MIPSVCVMIDDIFYILLAPTVNIPKTIGPLSLIFTHTGLKVKIAIGRQNVRLYIQFIFIYLFVNGKNAKNMYMIYIVQA